MRTLFSALLSVALFAPVALAKDAGLTDGNIMAIAMTANQGEIDQAKLAVANSTNDDVKKFAEQMVLDHGGALSKESALAAKISVAPEDNDDVAKLKKDGEALMTKLKGLSGPAFDKAYIAAQIDEHQAVLDALDKKLIPNAKNPDLKKHVNELRPAVVMHLAHAKGIQKKLGN